MSLWVSPDLRSKPNTSTTELTAQHNTNSDAMSSLIVDRQLHTPSYLHHSRFPRHPIVFSACVSLNYCRLPETNSSSAQTAQTVCSVLCLCQVKVSVSKRKLYAEFIPSHPKPQRCLFRLYKLDLTSAAAVYRVIGSLCKAGCDLWK